MIWAGRQGRFSCQSYAGGTEIGCATDGAPWQRGVEEELYQEISPEVCLWPTPDWLWDNVQDGVAGAGSYKTPIVRGWMVTLGVKKNLCVKDGDQILR